MPRRIEGNTPSSTANLARRLAKARTEKGLTQAELGQRLGVPQSHLSSIERGRTDPRVSSLLELARVLDLEIMLVPRELVPVVSHLVDPGTAEADRQSRGQFLYRLTDQK